MRFDKAIVWTILGLVASAPLAAALASRSPSLLAALVGVLALLWVALRAGAPVRGDWLAIGLLAALAIVALLGASMAQAGVEPTLIPSLKVSAIILAGILGALCVATAPMFARPLAKQVLIAGFPLGLVILWLNAAGDGAIYRVTNRLGQGDLVDGATFDRSVLGLAVMLWPVVGCIANRRVAGLVSFVLCIALAGAVIFTESQSGPVVIAVSLAAYWLVRLTGRFGIALMAGMAALYIGVAPWLFIALHGPASGLFGTWTAASAGARLDIWKVAGLLALERPLTGWGLDAMLHMGGIFSSGEPFMTAAGKTGAYHPHNFALQAWLDLGIAGVVIIIALILWAFYRCSHLANTQAAAGAAMLAALLVAGSLAPGLWQGWWLATIALALCQCILATRVPEPFAMDHFGERT